MSTIGFIGSSVDMTPNQIAKVGEIIKKLKPSEVVCFNNASSRSFMHIVESVSKRINITQYKDIIDYLEIANLVSNKCDIVLACVENNNENSHKPVWNMVWKTRQNGISTIILYPN